MREMIVADFKGMNLPSFGSVLPLFESLDALAEATVSLSDLQEGYEPLLQGRRQTEYCRHVEVGYEKYIANYHLQEDGSLKLVHARPLNSDSAPTKWFS